MKNRHPIQPLELVDGILRFKSNAIVKYILASHPTVDLNALAHLDFSKEDWEQFAQLTGGSFSYCGDLPYFGTDTLHLAKMQYDRPQDPRDARIEQLEEQLEEARNLMADGVAKLYGIHPDDLMSEKDIYRHGEF